MDYGIAALEVMRLMANHFGRMVITTTVSGWRIEIRDKQDCILFSASGETFDAAMYRLQEHILKENER